MKYVGVSSPAWTVPKNVGPPGASPTPGIYKYEWERSLDRIQKKRDQAVLHYTYARTTLPHHADSKKPDREPPQAPCARSHSEKQPEKAPADEEGPKKPATFNRVPRFKVPEPATGPTVGPQSYAPKESPARASSLGYKCEQDSMVRPKEGVGPAHYDPRPAAVSKRSALISSEPAQRVQERVLNSGLGPGTYEAHLDPPSTSFHSLKGTFARAGKQALIRAEASTSLGPQSYTHAGGTIEQGLKDRLKKGAMAGRARRRSLDAPGPSPGPGKYNTRPESLSAVGGAVARAGRSDGNKSASPGPATYRLESFADAKPRKTKKERYTTFGSAERDAFSFEKARHLPGPADYDPRKLSSHITATLKKRVKQPRDLNVQVPGPGRYELASAGFFAPGRRLRGPVYRPPHDKGIACDRRSPGPQDYRVSLVQVDPAAAPLGVRFPRERRQMRWQQGDPEIDTGPGIYDLKSTLPNVAPFEAPEYKDRGIAGLLT